VILCGREVTFACRTRVRVRFGIAAYGATTELAGGLMQSQYGGRVRDDRAKRATSSPEIRDRPPPPPPDLVFRIHRNAWELKTGYTFVLAVSPRTNARDLSSPAASGPSRWALPVAPPSSRRPVSLVPAIPVYLVLPRVGARLPLQRINQMHL